MSPAVSSSSPDQPKILWPILAIAFRSMDACQVAAFRSAPFNSMACGFSAADAHLVQQPFAASLWRFSLFCLACAKRPCGRLNGDGREGLSADPLPPRKKRERTRSPRQSVSGHEALFA